MLGGIIKYDKVFAENKSPMNEFLGQEVSLSESKLKQQFPGIEFTFAEGVNDWYKYILLEVLNAMPKKHVDNLESVSVEGLDIPVRGVASLSMKSKGDIKLRFDPKKFPLQTKFSCKTVQECLTVTSPIINRQWIGVLVHEFGHNTDLGKSTYGNSSSGTNNNFSAGSYTMFNDDPSVAYFYPICYESGKVLSAKNCDRNDFVSSYAKTSAFEDAAESLTTYVLDGPNLKAVASASQNKGDDSLIKKYNYFKDQIFDGQEFYLSDKETKNLFSTYDATTRKFAYKTFLYKAFIKNAGYSSDPFSSYGLQTEK